MCYAIPAKLVAIENNVGTVDYFGEQRKILIDIEDIKIGDYVYAQGGVLIRKISEDEALDILQHWQEIFFQLKKTDAALAKIDPDTLSQNALQVLQKVNFRKSLKKEEMLTLLNLSDSRELNVLYEIANNVRQREHGNSSCVHGIIEFSNYCHNNCHYCGIREDRDLPRYRMSVEEIITIAREAVNLHGFKAIVLQSGEDLFYTDEHLVTIVKELRKMGILIFLSLGSRSKETYRKLYEAGARAALVRFETSNENVFGSLRPGTNLAERIELIKYLKKLGFVLATGFIIGLPNTTTADLINDILMTKYLAPDMYSFGPLIPSAATPLAKINKIPKDLVLKTIAVTRFVDSNANILVTTALETLNKAAKKDALLAGANSLMVNITPLPYRSLYAIYDHRSGIHQTVEKTIQETVELLYSLGRAPTDLGIK